MYRSPGWAFYSSKSYTASQLSALLPVILNSSKYEDIEPGTKLYSQFFLDDNLVALQTQYMRWQQYWDWDRQKTVPCRHPTVQEALRVVAELGTWPAVSVWFWIFAFIHFDTSTVIWHNNFTYKFAIILRPLWDEVPRPLTWASPLEPLIVAHFVKS
jgi:hypothetical protein